MLVIKRDDTSKSAIMVSLVVHCKDVFHWRVGLDIVAGSEDVTSAVTGEGINAMPHFSADFIWGAERQNALVFHSTVEAETVAELTFEGSHFHAWARPLHRVEDINPHFNEKRQKRTDTTIIMVKHFDAELMAKINEALVMRSVEFTINLQADQRAVLAAEIVSHLSDVNETLADFKHAAVMIVKEIADSIEEFVGELRIFERVDECLFEATEEDMLIKGSHVTALHRAGGARGAGGLSHGGVIKPVSRGPGVPVQIVYGLCVGEGIQSLLLVRASRIGNAGSANAPKVDGFVWANGGKRRADVARLDAGKAINMQGIEDVHGGAEASA